MADRADDRYALAVMLCFCFTQTHMKFVLNFHFNFLSTIFARLPPLASATRCCAHPLATPLRRSQWRQIVTATGRHRRVDGIL